MKKITLALIALFIINLGYAQEANNYLLRADKVFDGQAIVVRVIDHQLKNGRYFSGSIGLEFAWQLVQDFVDGSHSRLDTT